MEERQIVKLTGLPVSKKMQDILSRLARKQKVSIEEINDTKEMKMAWSNVDFSRPTIQLDNRLEMQADILNKMNNFGSIKIDEDGNTVYNGQVREDSRLDIVIGLPASGKSSAIVDIISQEFGSKIIDNDEAKKMIPQYNNGWGAGVVHEESQKISDSAFRVALALKQNIILPKVGSSAERILSTYVEPAAEAGYEINVHFVDLDRDIALGRMLNRFIEDGRFLDPNLIDQYCNEREGNKIQQSYERLKESKLVHGFSKWNNNVGRGESPILMEYSNLKGEYIDYARKDEENEQNRKGNTQNIRIDSRDSRTSRGNESEGSSQNEGEQRTNNEGYDTDRGYSSNGPILQVNLTEKQNEFLRQKEAEEQRQRNQQRQEEEKRKREEQQKKDKEIKTAVSGALLLQEVQALKAELGQVKEEIHNIRKELDADTRRQKGKTVVKRSVRTRERYK